MYFLHIETATKICSVAISKNGVYIDELSELGTGFIHGEKLTLFIEQLLSRNQITVSDLSAISVSLGPGSYTGLRIGLSSAKGLCYGLNIPLIGISSLQSLIRITRSKYPNKIICAAIDARRDEVFRRIENEDAALLANDAPEILVNESYEGVENMVWVGDASEKCSLILKNKNITFDHDIQISAKGQIELAWIKYENEEFENLAYCVPNYTKAFQNPI